PLSWNTRSISHQSLDSGEASGFDDEAPIFEADADGPVMGDFAAEGGEGVGGDGCAEEVDEAIDPEQLESVLSLLQSTADGSLESTLDGMRLTLHPQFVIRVLETPLLVSDNVLRFFRWASSKHSDLEVTTPVLQALVRCICAGGEFKRRDVYALWDLIKEVGEKGNGVLDVAVLNPLIASLSRLGKGKAALEVLDRFDEFGCVPDDMSYYFAIEALCRRSMYDHASSVCERMLNAGCLPDGHKVGKIISWLCKGKKAKCAYSVYSAAKDGNSPSQSSMNFLIASLCREDQTVKLGWELLGDLKGEARKNAIKPFSAVVGSLCRSGDLNGARELLNKMIAEGPAPGNAVFNYVINGCSKAKEMGLARELVKLMEARGLKPDVYTYTVIISGYANSGEMDQAKEVLLEAKRKHSKLTPVTYHTLIRGYCKLEEFDKALELLSDMKDFGVQPNADEYNKLIQSLCLKALDWEKAEKLLEEMKERGLYLNGITRGLIKATKELESEVADNGEPTAVA
ncbi:uncharacterized protein J3R85_017660, partial [Psidium guajava]